MKLFIDDIRFPHTVGYVDEDWTIARNYEDAIDLIFNNEVTHISFDHDLGLNEGGEIAKNGYDVAVWLEQCLYYGAVTTVPEMVVHSANPVGRKRIEQVIQSINNRRGN